MDWKKILKGLTSARDVINSVGSPGREMSAGEKFIQTTKNLSEKYDVGYNIGQNIRRNKREAEMQKKLPPKKKQTQSQPNYGMGNIDLNNRPVVNNPDGSKSTVLSFSIQDERDGKETLIPQVVNGKVVSEDEAIKHYYETGEHLGKFNSIEEADDYAEKLHLAEEARIGETPQNYQVNTNMWNRVEQQAALNLADAQRAKEALQSDKPIVGANKTKQQLMLDKYDSDKLMQDADQQAEYEKLVEKLEKNDKLTDAQKAELKARMKIKHFGQKVFQKPRSLADGWQVGDLSTSAMSTILGTTSHFVQGAESVGGSVLDTGARGVAAIAKDLGYTDFSNRLNAAVTKNREEQKEINNKYFNKLLDPNSVLGEKGNEAAESAGQSYVFGAVGNMGKSGKRLANLLTFSMGASGGMEEASKDENAKGWEILLKGFGGGASSYITENMFDWMGYGGNKLTKEAKENFGNYFNSGMGKALAKLGFSAGGEASEEIAEEILNKEVVNTIVNMALEEHKYDTNVDWEEAIENAGVAVLSVLGGGAPGAIQSGATIDSNRKLLEKANLTENQKALIGNLSEEYGASKETVSNYIQSAENNNQKIDEKWKDVKVSGKAGETGRLTKKQLPTIENKTLSESNQQTIQEETKTPENTSSQGIDKNVKIQGKTKETLSKNAYESKPKEGTIRLYTNTSAKNIESILNEGLKTDKAQQKEYEGNMTWFETRPDLKGYGGTTIAVDVPINARMEKANNTQYMVYDDISPEDIVFVDKPVFNQYRTSDIEDLLNKYGKEKVLEVFDKSKNQFTTRDEFVEMIDSLENNNVDVNPQKEKQLEIIKNTNPMRDDYHVGIRNVEDIKTFEEAIEDDESFIYGDYSKEDAKRDLEKGTVTVYSSKPIEQGGFVSTSQNMAKDYAGNGEIYSKEVPINDVAWINGDEGQYAKIEQTPKTQKLEERVSGDALLNAQDLIDEVKSVNANVDENGYITLYHQTTSENAKKIKETGKMSGKEDGIFFSTSKEASQSEGRGDAKLEFKIPAEMLELDDIFDNNADLRIPLKNKNESFDVSQYLVDTNQNKTESKPKNIGVHFGDLGKGRDTSYYSMGRGSRSTGYFGTGTYFFSEEASNSENGQRFGKDKPRHEVDFSNYNLFRPTTSYDANKLHDELKNVTKFDYEDTNLDLDYFNDFKFDSFKMNTQELLDKIKELKLAKPKTIDEYKQYVLNDTNESERQETEEYLNEERYDGTTNLDYSYKRYLRDILSDAKSKALDLNGLKTSLQSLFGFSNASKINNALKTVKDYVENTEPNYKEMQDSLSTVFMKAMGYEGIDVRGYDNVDNSSYGSVIYDLKNNESAQDEGSFIVPENAASNENIEKIEDEDLKEIKKNSLLNAEDNTKERSFPISAQESDTLSEEVKKENSQRILKTESGRYTPIANQTTIDEANETIQKRGADNRLAAFNEKFENNEKIELKDLAEAELLIQHYSDLGDSKTAVDLIEKVGILGTELGQMVQALSIIKKMTPEGQLRVANRLAERLSQKYDTDIKLSDEVKNEIKNSKMENLDEAMDKAYTELAEQIPLTFKEQLDNFRFLAMLGNPKTHIRNIVGNVGNRALTGTKNKVKGLIEEAVGMAWKDYQKDATIRFANKDQRTFAKMDAEILGEDIDNVSNKYKDSPNSEIERRKRNFNKTNIPVLKWVVEGANWAADKNAMLLNKEDAMALKAAYRDAMQNYMAANNLSSEDLTILDSDSKSVADQKERALKNAREYAARQAQEATFHQANQIATWLNNLSRQDQLPSRILGLMVDATVPFKKTPLNIVRQGVAYSPFNLIRSAGGFAIDMNTSMKKLKTQLDSGKITKQQFSEKASKMVNERIDQFSKGLTGSGIALLGVFLNQLGLLKAGDNDDEDEYETALGKQEYSLNIGDYSISLEWLSPSAMPMFMGAEISDLFKNDEDMTNWGTLLSGSTRLLEPAFDTTMLSSLTSALKSYGQDTKGAIGDMATNAAVSYLMQYYPSLFTNIAKTIDPVYRDTTSTKKGFEKKVESAKNRLISQVPFKSRTLESKKDAYGEDVQRAKTLPGRIAENFLNPATIKKITSDKTTAELERLSEKTDVTGLLKTSSDLSKDYTIDGVKHRYDSVEYSKAKGQYGKTIKSTLDALIKSDSYKKLSDPEKAEMIKDIYEYSRETAKTDYAKKHSLPYSSKNDMYNSLTAIKQAGGKAVDYFKFKVDTNDMTSKAERMTYLNKMSLPDKVKKAIYENDVATYQAVSSGTDEHYNALKSITGDKVSSDYLDYVEKNSSKYFVGDKDANGKAIKGREKKDKVREFINNSNMSNIEKYYVYTKEGYAKSLSQKQRSELRTALESNKNYMDEETYNSMIKKLNEAEK